MRKPPVPPSLFGPFGRKFITFPGMGRKYSQGPEHTPDVSKPKEPPKPTSRVSTPTGQGRQTPSGDINSPQYVKPAPPQQPPPPKKQTQLRMDPPDFGDTQDESAIPDDIRQEMEQYPELYKPNYGQSQQQEPAVTYEDFNLDNYAEPGSGDIMELDPNWEVGDTGQSDKEDSSTIEIASMSGEDLRKLYEKEMDKFRDPEKNDRRIRRVSGLEQDLNSIKESYLDIEDPKQFEKVWYQKIGAWLEATTNAVDADPSDMNFEDYKQLVRYVVLAVAEQTGLFSEGDLDLIMNETNRKAEFKWNMAHGVSSKLPERSKEGPPKKEDLGFLSPSEGFLSPEEGAAQYEDEQDDENDIDLSDESFDLDLDRIEDEADTADVDLSEEARMNRWFVQASRGLQHPSAFDSFEAYQKYVRQQVIDQAKEDGFLKDELMEAYKRADEFAVDEWWHYTEGSQ